MPRRARAPQAPLLAWALAAGAALIFAAALVPAHAPRLRTIALVAIAAAVLIHLMRYADPAWLISGGIAASMFSGNWTALGINSHVVPDRVLLVAGVATVVFRWGRARERPPLELGRVHFVLAAALAYATVSMLMVNTTSDHSSFFALIDQFGAIPFLVFAVAPVVFRTRRQRAILLGSLVATGAYLSLTALFEKLGITSLIVPSYINDPNVGIHFGRARGPFVEAVADGLALYACGVAAVIAFVIWRRLWLRLLALAVAALCIVGVLLTVTRAVWLGAVVATLVVLATTRRLRRYMVPVAIAGLCLVLGAFAAIPGLATLAHQRQNDRGPVWQRQNSDAAALRMIEARPFVGFGWGRHNAAAEPYFRLAPNIPLSGEIAGQHNLFLTYAVDLGLVGFALWIGGAALAFGGAVRRRGPPDLEPWRVGLGALVVCYISSGIAGPLAYQYPTLLLWTWAGVTYRGRPRPVGEPMSPGATAGRPVGELMAAGRPAVNP